jgi:hypothetical protein
VARDPDGAAAWTREGIGMVCPGDRDTGSVGI